MCGSGWLPEFQHPPTRPLLATTPFYVEEVREGLCGRLQRRDLGKTLVIGDTKGRQNEPGIEKRVF